MSHTPLSLADRLRAVATLRPRGKADAAALLALLQAPVAPGAVSTAASRAAASIASDTPAPTEAPASLRPPPAAEPSSETATEAPARRRSAGAATRPSRVTPLPRQPFAAPMPVTPQLPPARPLRPAPIIGAAQARAVLAALAASAEAGASIDVPRLVERIANGRPIERLPRRIGFSTRHGAQLLVDCAGAMAPLQTDVDAVALRLQQLLGRDRLQTLYFAGCPLRGAGPGARGDWTPHWEPPVAGVPVIVLTDLGITWPADPHDWAPPAQWLRFARAARDAGCPVSVLLPYPLRRVDPRLVRSLPIVPWSERLDAARVRRILRDALPRHRRS